MKKVILAILMVVLISSPVVADMTVTMANSYGSTGGGEFKATPGSGWSFTPESLDPTDGVFETFCVEKNEYFRLGSTYYVKISTAADAGGVLGGPLDPLDAKTAYLYKQFITGNLVGYDYDNTGVGRETSANALQHVIWYLEEEESVLTSGTLIDTFYADACQNAGTGIGNVRIMNMYGDAEMTTYKKQDQLIMVPVTIPAPGALLLGSLGTMLVGYFRRRRIV